jgi:hypothetical protein
MSDGKYLAILRDVAREDACYGPNSSTCYSNSSNNLSWKGSMASIYG